jgi:DNA-binding NarL/FixJ family response regulator
MKRKASVAALTASPDALSVLLVDGHVGFRKGMRELLDGKEGFAVAGDMVRVNAAVTAIARSNPEVVLVGLSGRARIRLLHAVQKLNEAGHQVRTMVLMDTIEAGDVTQAERLGISGLLRRDSPSSVVCAAIRTVAAGQCWLGRERVDVLTKKSEAAYGLTPRELEIVKSVCRGDSNQKISQQLSIRLDTVKHHLTHIFAKLGVSTRLQLALFALDKEWARSAAVTLD